MLSLPPVRFIACVLMGTALPLAAAGLVAAQEDSQPISFNRDIRPLLADRCYACHGPDAETLAADLRFDLRESATAEGAIVPGEPDQSELIARIESDSPYDIMPPPSSNKSLTPAERELFRRWIAQGAAYEAHWAYAPLDGAASSPANGEARDAWDELPDDHWAQNWKDSNVDQAIARQLMAAGVEPNPTADRTTLIRRLSFDLTGLPPTYAEVQDFLNDRSEHAYENLVDRLLASPRFGERMAIYWLDLVRYADTVGYHGDQDVSQSPYRDYVINAFNNNKPYDQFVREQLAGDLLPDATREQLIASGYNRLNQTTEEGGAQPREYLAIYFADRVRNVSQVFMGATVGCAQCHDHKFDPYSMKDFYSLGAFFADLQEQGKYDARSRPPMIPVPDAGEQQQLDALQQQLEKLREQLAKSTEQVLAQQSDWELQVLAQLQDKPVAVDHRWLGPAQDPGGKREGQWNRVEPPQPSSDAGDAVWQQKSNGLIQHYFDNSPSPVVVDKDTRFFAWVFLDPAAPPQALMLQLNDGNWEHRGVWGADPIPYGRRDESWAGYYRRGDLPAAGQWVRLELSAADVGLAENAKVDGMAFTQFGGNVFWGAAGWVADPGPPQSIVTALQIAAAGRSPEQSRQIEEYYLSNSATLAPLQQQIAEVEAARTTLLNSVTRTVISRSVEPRTIRILHRGNWMDDSGEVVQPAIPEFLGRLDTGDRRATRLDLANWLCQPDNVLTSRTLVNRLWYLLFGRGIATSVDDLGAQGTFPANPELLDRLALDFVESGWDIKSTIKSIVMSRAYRQSSAATAEQLNADPQNELFARQGRFRIDAEIVRDTALAISGLLVEQIGGDSVKPYQPPGYYAQLNFPVRTYQADSGNSQYRRGVYTHWQRTFLHPMLKAFDAPSREEGACSRARSNTPLQALTLLNDPTFVEAARVFAERILQQPEPTAEARIRWAYRQALSREPEPAIVAEIQTVLAQHLEHYRSDTEAAEKLLAVGQAPVAQDLEPAELAAWTSVSRIILNLHELTTRY